MEIKPTNRGFMRGEFTDLYGQACSIQESSLADQRALWLGAEPNRMHLTQKQAAELIPLLAYFAVKGELPK